MFVIEHTGRCLKIRVHGQPLITEATLKGSSGKRKLHINHQGNGNIVYAIFTFFTTFASK